MPVILRMSVVTLWQLRQEQVLLLPEGSSLLTRDIAKKRIHYYENKGNRHKGARYHRA